MSGPDRRSTAEQQLARPRVWVAQRLAGMSAKAEDRNCSLTGPIWDLSNKRTFCLRRLQLSHACAVRCRCSRRGMSAGGGTRTAWRTCQAALWAESCRAFGERQRRMRRKGSSDRQGWCLSAVEDVSDEGGRGGARSSGGITNSSGAGGGGVHARAHGVTGAAHSG
jgi:hypothetical protein